MLVIFKCKLWQIDMPFELFQSFKEKHSNMEVELEEVTQSNYKEKVIACLIDVIEYSYWRNVVALSN
jgi:hypothetical protein